MGAEPKDGTKKALSRRPSASGDAAQGLHSQVRLRGGAAADRPEETAISSSRSPHIRDSTVRVINRN